MTAVAVPGTTEIPEINLQIKAERGLLPEDRRRISRDEVYVSAAELKFPLSLRFWRPGDFFKPLGISGTQKLHDFFINRKIPKCLRNRVPILVNADGRIIWLIGYQLSDEFKIVVPDEGVWHISACRGGDPPG